MAKCPCKHSVTQLPAEKVLRNGEIWALIPVLALSVYWENYFLSLGQVLILERQIIQPPVYALLVPSEHTFLRYLSREGYGYLHAEQEQRMATVSK